MKVHYRQKITERLAEAIRYAREINRDIDFIELDATESAEFKRLMITDVFPVVPGKPYGGNYYMGIEIRTT